WVSANVNNNLYRVNGAEFIQIFKTLSDIFRVGIPAGSGSPTISYIAGGSGSIVTGITVSYSYMNSQTGHVGRPSGISNTLGASGGNNTLRIPVTASTEIGVDKIVVFATLDGGSIPFLLINGDGTTRTFTNTTGNIDISLNT